MHYPAPCRHELRWLNCSRVLSRGAGPAEHFLEVQCMLSAQSSACCFRQPRLSVLQIIKVQKNLEMSAR
ncbi:hypothetical protein U0070_012920 [Myodes glareolus]|uniref:Uncharacterized protein n=1 Tax=Myodes glareolus TaxID=447135 RepID=A0AAW0GY61_MYOGA